MEGNLNQIVETPPQLSRKPLVQKSSWECNRKKISRYSPKAPPDIRIPCQHFSKAYRCTSLAKNDIIKFNNAFYKSTKKIDQDNFILQHIKTSPIQRRRPKSGTGNKKNFNITYYYIKAFYNLLKEEKEELLILSFDCQKNQPMPKVPDQSAYYSRQLYVYNFTIVIGSSKSKLSSDNVFIYTWTEDILPKASNEIASAVFHCLCSNIEKYENVTTIRLVADGCSGQNKNTSVLGMLCKYLKDYAPERIKSVELLFPVVGHSFLPPDRVFAQIEKNIKKNEVITNPQDYYKIFNEHGTVLKLGSEIIVQDWKEASTEILKGTNAMHFSIKQCKRFFIKRNKQKLNVLVRAEESYHNALGTYKNICKKNKTVSLINPKNKQMNVAVKKEKLDDVIKLLKAHYGDQWEPLPDLEYYKNVIQRSISDNSISYSNERCEMEEELPNLII